MRQHAIAIGDDEAYKKYVENWRDAIGELNSTIENFAEHLRGKYLNTVNEILDNWQQGFSGTSLGFLEENFASTNMLTNNRLDKVEGYYAIESLRNKFSKAADSTTDLALQKKINSVMEEQVKILEEKDKLTQYDVERAEKVYDLTMKQIALEEAQRNKTQLQLKRDGSGGYSYQFVADEDAYNSAADSLREAEQSLYAFDKEALKAKLAEIQAAYAEMYSKIQEISENESLSEQQKIELIDQVRTNYTEHIISLAEEYKDIQGNIYDDLVTYAIDSHDKQFASFAEMNEIKREIFRRVNS